MYMPCVSIIVPIYNAEKYISKCLHSIREQTFTDYECLLINDGSTDNSFEIISQIVSGDNRFIVYNKSNSGPAATRNMGFDLAKGTYILCIDADDWIDSTYVASLVEAMQDGTHLVCSRYIDHSAYGDVLCHDFKTPIYDTKSLIQCILQGTGGVLWGKIFRNDIIQQYKIRLEKNLYMSEDMIFLLNYVHYIHSWKEISLSGYHYNRMNDTSISSSISLSYIDNYSTFFKYLSKSLLSLGFSSDWVERIIIEKAVGVMENFFQRERNVRKVCEAFQNNPYFHELIEGHAEEYPLLKKCKEKKYLPIYIRFVYKRNISTIKNYIRGIVRSLK